MSLRRVLIVHAGDDGGALRVRDFLGEMAGLGPGALDHAGGTEEALARLAAGGYDLCIVDGREGSTDGVSFLREARNRGIDTPAVLMTGSAPLSADIKFATVLSEAERRRYRAEDALLRSEERFRTLFDAVPVGLYRTASDRRIVNANPAMAQMLGYPSVEALLGTDAEQLYADPGVRRDWARQLETKGLVQGFEARLLRRDGTALWSLESARATLDDAGRILHIEGTVQDITERKQAELRLLERETQYRLLFDANPYPMAVIDLDTERFVAVNDASVRTYGFSRAEFLSMTAADIRPPDQLPAYREAMEKVRAAGGSFEAETVHVRKDGTPFEVHGKTSAMTFAGRPALLVATTDISDHKRAAAALEKLEGQLRQSQKMEAIGQLAGGVAHDFNNLLGVIIGYSELLLRDLAAGSPGARRMTEIRNAADRAAGLTKQLLAFSRRQVLQPRVLDLNAVVAEAETMLARVIDENVEIVTVLGSGLRRVRADPGQIQQVILNFAVNARDAMPDGGRLVLETRNVDITADDGGRHPALPPGPYVVLLVSDTGHGMPPEVLEHMFEPFFTTRGQGHGTGLGLATVYGVVTQSGGHVEVESAVGSGTTFRVYLPVADPLSGEEPAGAGPALPRASETVLVIEDAEPLREMVQEILEAEGYRVLSAENGQRALAVAAAHDGPIGVVITDVVMPGMSGPTVAEKLLALRPGARVLFMSGYTDEAMGQHGVLDGATHFIQKPFSADALLRKVREVLAQGAGA